MGHTFVTYLTLNSATCSSYDSLVVSTAVITAFCNKTKNVYPIFVSHFCYPFRNQSNQSTVNKVLELEVVGFFPVAFVFARTIALFDDPLNL